MDKGLHNEDLIFVKRIKTLMNVRGWNMAELAKRCGISLALTYRYLSNEYKNPTLKNLTKFAVGLGVPVSYLLGEEVSFASEEGVARDFVSVFKWSLNREGEREKSLGSLMFSRELLESLKAPPDLLDVVEMIDNSMRPLLNKGDDLLCLSLPENDLWIEIENGAVYLFFYKNVMYVSRLRRNMDDSISVWQESSPNQVNDLSKDEVKVRYRVIYRCGLIE